MTARTVSSSGRCRAAARAAPQPVEPDVDVAVAGLDQTVGVEGEQAALGQLHLDGLEGQPPEAERGPAGRSGKVTLPCGPTTRAAGGRPGPWCSVRVTGS